MREFSAEFQLAIACCRWPPGPERNRCVQARAPGVDWATFLKLIRRQRVEGLANDALRQAGAPLPTGITAELAAMAGTIARENLGYAAESRRINKVFAAAGLRHLFVKGGTLDMLAYGSLGLKRARDIDIVVEPQKVGSACALLSDLGYERIAPGPEIDHDRFGLWVQLCKETNWRHPRTAIIIELHSQLVDNAALLPGVSAHSPSQSVQIGPGITLPTLRAEDLFAYLCVHGATHAWSRLKWIADVAALLSHRSSAEIEELYRYSLASGVGRCSAQALLLCQDLFQTPLPDDLRAELGRDRVTRWLSRLALRAMQTEAELDDTVLGTVPIHVSHFLLGQGWRFKASELARKLHNHEDQVRMNLPRSLHLLYPIISLPSWLWRRLQGQPAR